MDCDFCKHIFTNLFSFSNPLRAGDEIEWTDHDFYPHFPNLGLSASSCRLCGFLRRAIADDFGVRPIDSDAAATEDTLSRWDGKVSFKSKKISPQGTTTRFIRLGLELGWSRRDIDMSFYNPSRTSWTSRPDGSLFRVGCCRLTDWMCRLVEPVDHRSGSRSGSPIRLDSHPKMARPVFETRSMPAADTAFVSTRLLDVGDEAADRHLRVVLGEKLGGEASYAALSYCWGNTPSSRRGAESARTVRDNLAARLVHVSEEPLPRTIRDAITITRRLGIRYLWVDLLCIVQDDPVDWSNEAQLMGDVFHHASLTIAASSAASMTQGFLRRPRCRRIRLRLDGDAGQPDLILRYPVWKLHEEVDDSSWSTRGWIFQERRLSRKVLHFTRGNLYFECASGLRCECVEMRPELPDKDLQIIKTMTRWRPRCSLEPDRAATFDAWYRDVEEFSAKVFTFPEDKLPAIAGLSRATAKMVGGRYLAGLWMEDLHFGLLWGAHTGCKLRRRPRSRAPSWSWAALDGAVKWEGYRSDPAMPLAKVLNADVVPDPSDPQGRLFTGCLGLDACLMTLQDAEDPGELDEYSGINWFYHASSGSYFSDLGVEFTRLSRLWVLPILFAHDYLVCGLILEPTGDGSHEFRRFGWYESPRQRDRVLGALGSHSTTSVKIV